MKNIIIGLGLAASSLLLSSNVHALEIVIDDFTTPQGPIEDTGGSPASSQVMGNIILGDYRDLYVEETADIVDLPGGGISVGVGSGLLSVSNDAGVTGFIVATYDGSNAVGDDWDKTISVDGVGVDTNGLASGIGGADDEFGIDFSGATNFLFDTLSVDVDNPATLTVWTNDNGDGTTYVEHSVDILTQQVDIPGEERLVAFNSFSDSANINWSRVGAIQAIFNRDNSEGTAQMSADFLLSKASVVPEPTVLTMFGADILALGFAGYRRKEQE